MGVGVGGWVREAMLRESHCKRNESCTGEQKHGKERNLKNLGHIRTIFARFSREWKLHANANETCERDMRARHANMHAKLTIFCESKRC